MAKSAQLEHPEIAERLIREGHEHGVQVLISVGGWSYLDVPLEDTFIKATETPEKTEKLADAIAAMVEEYGFDGADMDWEHPRVKKARTSRMNICWSFWRRSFTQKESF